MEYFFKAPGGVMTQIEYLDIVKRAEKTLHYFIQALA